MASTGSAPTWMWEADDVEERKWNHLLETDEMFGKDVSHDLNSSPNEPDLEFDLPMVDWEEEEQELTRGLEMNEIYLEKRRSIAVNVSNKRRSACAASDGDYLIAKNKAIEKVDQIIAKNVKFKDSRFSSSTPKKILFRDANQATIASFKSIESKIACWKRLTTLIEDPVVFCNGIDAKDIKQGSIGTCWFLSALSVISSKEERIKRCLVKYDVALGVYGFVFFKNGKWHHVIIDDFFPISKKSHGLLFSRSTDPQEVWVALFEKAFAKLHGSYEMIVGGHVSNAVVDLTAGCSSIFPLKKLDDGAKLWLWKQLANNASKNWRCTGCCTYKKQRSKTGLVSGHAYGIIGTYKSHEIQLVQIRNPWGHCEWKGDWSDKSATWQEHPEIAKKLKLVKRNDGVFWMSWDDFLAQWDRVYLVKCFSENWKAAQRFGTTSRGGVYSTTFHLDTPGPLSIMVQPECKAFKGTLKRKNTYPPLSFSVLEEGKEIAAAKVNGFRGASWWSAAPGYTCPAGEYTIQIHYRTKNPSPFYVRVYARTDITLSNFQ